MLSAVISWYKGCSVLCCLLLFQGIRGVLFYVVCCDFRVKGVFCFMLSVVISGYKGCSVLCCLL